MRRQVIYLAMRRYILKVAKAQEGIQAWRKTRRLSTFLANASSEPGESEDSAAAWHVQRMEEQAFAQNGIHRMASIRPLELSQDSPSRKEELGEHGANLNQDATAAGTCCADATTSSAATAKAAAVKAAAKAPAPAPADRAPAAPAQTRAIDHGPSLQAVPPEGMDARLDQLQQLITDGFVTAQAASARDMAALNARIDQLWLITGSLATAQTASAQDVNTRLDQLHQPTSLESSLVAGYFPRA